MISRARGALWRHDQPPALKRSLIVCSRGQIAADVPVAAAMLAFTAIGVTAQVDVSYAPPVSLGATATTVAILVALLAGVLIGAQTVRASKISDWAKDR